jgi:porin
VFFDGPGLPLANPASEGIPVTHRGDFGLYAITDQMIYRWSDDPGRNISVFARPEIAPQQDRNFLVFNFQTGVTAHGLIAGRNDDVFGVGVTYAQVSDNVTGFDQLRAALEPGVFIPVRHNETVIEATYQYQATPSLEIQPDFQYVFNPGAGVANPNDPTEKVKDEAVLGVRATIAF